MRIPIAKPSILLCGHADPPTPEEIDTLLSAISAAGYASEAVETVEEWLEARYGHPGAFTQKLRDEEGS